MAGDSVVSLYFLRKLYIFEKGKSGFTRYSNLSVRKETEVYFLKFLFSISEGLINVALLEEFWV